MDNKIYLNILYDTLVKKSDILNILIDLTNSQTEALTVDKVNIDEFEDYVEKKRIL